MEKVVPGSDLLLPVELMLWEWKDCFLLMDLDRFVEIPRKLSSEFMVPKLVLFCLVLLKSGVIFFKFGTCLILGILEKLFFESDPFQQFLSPEFGLG